MRFAILCRVSTEGQEKEGVSLEVQQKTLSKCVESLNGQLVKEYIGQESAMTQKERPILDEVLADCSKDLFDSLMIYDLSRLTRDPIKSKIIFATLKKNNIKLYVQSQENDLNSPENNLFVGLMSEINQFYVNLQTKKSMASKIELARRGWSITSKPFGRKLVHNDKSKNAEWEVIPECKELAERIYDLYVNQNLATDKIAKLLEIEASHLRKILFDYSGNEWIQKVRYENRNEIIITKVPSLLSPEQIERAKHKAKNNRQFNSRKHPYLLGGRVKCGVCRTHYVGMSANSSGIFRRYYTHSRHFRTDRCIKNIQVDVIETAVIKAVSDLFSSTKNLKMAIENAIGVSRDRKELLIKKIEEGEKELNKLERVKDKLVQSVIKSIFTDSEISKEMSKVREKTIYQQEQLKSYSNQLKTLEIDVPDDLHLRIQKYYQQLCGEEGSIIDWSYENKQKLLDWFFGISKDNGVFILYNGKKENGIAFNVVGALSGSLIGLISQSGNSFVVGADTWERNFSENQELVDFQKIIKDLDFIHENDAC